MLDGMVQLVLAGLGSTSRPAKPVPSALNVLGVAASGAGPGRGAGSRNGQRRVGCFSIRRKAGVPGLSGDRLVVFRGGAWGPWCLDLDQLEGVGIGNAADAVNRLSVAGEATLFSHTGGG